MPKSSTAWVATHKRMTFQLTQAAFSRLMAECEQRSLQEPCKVPPSRIINELILAHLTNNKDGKRAAKASS
jgi:hypothetical protein